MAKTRSSYVCQNCGAESSKWIGRCPSCGEWNTYVEEVFTKPASPASSFSGKNSSKPEKLKNISIQRDLRIDTRNNEFNRVLGGGLVPGSLVLIGGEPGIGKSTLALQVALNLPQLKIR